MSFTQCGSTGNPVLEGLIAHQDAIARRPAVECACPIMYGRPPFGKGFFDIAALGSGAVMYPAFVRGTS
jgi:hypothetical protein